MTGITRSFLLVASMLLFCSAVSAQEPPDGPPAEPPAADEATDAEKLRAQANQLTSEAVELKNRGDYPAAVTKFEQAYDLVPHPLLLYNIAQSHRLAGNQREALSYYRKFLAIATEGSEVEYSRRFVAELEASVEKAPPPDKPQAPEPADSASSAAAPGPPISSPAVATTVTTSRSIAPRGRHMTPLSWSLAGVSAAALGLGAYMTLSARSDFDSCKDRGSCTSNADVDSIERRLMAGDLLLGASLGAGIATVVVFWLSGDDDPKVGLDVGPESASLSATLRF
jgi:hypothetical protein